MVASRTVAIPVGGRSQGPWPGLARAPIHSQDQQGALVGLRNPAVAQTRGQLVQPVAPEGTGITGVEDASEGSRVTAAAVITETGSDRAVAGCVAPLGSVAVAGRAAGSETSAGDGVASRVDRRRDSHTSQVGSRCTGRRGGGRRRRIPGCGFGCHRGQIEGELRLAGLRLWSRGRCDFGMHRKCSAEHLGERCWSGQRIGGRCGVAIRTDLTARRGKLFGSGCVVCR